MALLVVNNGEVVALSYLTGKTASTELLDLRLYINDKTPAEADTLASYTEASGNGYALIQLTGGDWTITGGAPTEAVCAEKIFTFTGPLGNVYGYLLTRRTTVDLVWSERFSNGPYNIQNNGEQIKVTPKITGD